MSEKEKRKSDECKQQEERKDCKQQEEGEDCKQQEEREACKQQEEEKENKKSENKKNGRGEAETNRAFGGLERFGPALSVSTLPSLCDHEEEKDLCAKNSF